MKIALIHPGTPASLKKENLGLAYLSACLEADGHTARIVDEVAGQDVDAALDEFRPDVAGISCMTMQAVRAYALADRIRKERGLAVVLGGAHPSALPDEALQHGDCVIRGEAEWTFPRALARGKLEGIIEPEPPDDLDALPMPKREQLDLDFYADAGDELAGFSYRTLGCITSRGCPFHCTFCINSKRETRLRFHSAERVIEEIAYLVARHRIESVAFYDEMMVSDSPRFEALCRLLIERGLNRLCWECQMHARTVRPDLLSLMKRAGCIQVAIGFESGSQRVLDAIQKRCTIEQNIEAARRVHEAGLRLRGCFIVGAPGETRDELAQTERFIHEARVDFASIHYLTPMPGTALFDAFAERILGVGPSSSSDLRRPIPWDRFTAGDPETFTCNDAMPASEQKRLFLRLSARQAFRNYSWIEMARRALRNPRQALHVAAQLLR